MQEPPSTWRDPLATLVFLSDLHFGKIFWNQTRWIHEVAAAAFPRFQALYPHCYEAACALAVCVNNSILEKRMYYRIPTVVLHGGDLTRAGYPAEFAVGSTFLHGFHYTNPDRKVGLGLKSWDEADGNDKPVILEIPGNHDLWQRNHPDRLVAFRECYPNKFPIRRRINHPALTLLVYGLDSTRASKAGHRWARGEIDPPQLQECCEMLSEGRREGARQVVCLHHPFSKLENGTGIAKRLREAGADLVLSGHIHEYHVSDSSKKSPLHLVAGTATQMCSPRGFIVLDVFHPGIQWDYWEYDDNGTHFLPGTTEQRKWED